MSFVDVSQSQSGHLGCVICENQLPVVSNATVFQAQIIPNKGESVLLHIHILSRLSSNREGEGLDAIREGLISVPGIRAEIAGIGLQPDATSSVERTIDFSMAIRVVVVGIIVGQVQIHNPGAFGGRQHRVHEVVFTELLRRLEARKVVGRAPVTRHVYNEGPELYILYGIRGVGLLLHSVACPRVVRHHRGIGGLGPKERGEQHQKSCKQREMKHDEGRSGLGRSKGLTGQWR
mmetsp:Transcript_29351/g.73695  ORF Transcript_29351/g.73695 Transcript_29351/m.73695 type:complete len:234 (-) Transcript_29351:40-741(-)